MQRSTYIALTIAIAFIAGCATQQEPTWSEEFNGTELDTTIWNRIPQGPSPWDMHMSLEDSLVEVKDGELILWGVAGPDSSILTAGVSTKGKKEFCYGRLEIRAKMEGVGGGWPALWLYNYKDNPNHAEIDISERLNFDNYTYQTIHSKYNLKGLDSLQPKSAKGTIDPDGYNIFGVEHYKDSIRMFVNDSITLVYRRNPNVPDSLGQWPFDRNLFLMMDMQIGAPWPGEAVMEDLPVTMKIDWVRFYEFDLEN